MNMKNENENTGKLGEKIQAPSCARQERFSEVSLYKRVQTDGGWPGQAGQNDNDAIEASCVGCYHNS
jgi:hypothetical protein